MDNSTISILPLLFMETRTISQTNISFNQKNLRGHLMSNMLLKHQLLIKRLIVETKDLLLSDLIGKKSKKVS